MNTHMCKWMHSTFGVYIQAFKSSSSDLLRFHEFWLLSLRTAWYWIWRGPIFLLCHALAFPFNITVSPVSSQISPQLKSRSSRMLSSDPRSECPGLVRHHFSSTEYWASTVFLQNTAHILIKGCLLTKKHC